MPAHSRGTVGTHRGASWAHPTSFGDMTCCFGDSFGDRLGVDPTLDTLKIETLCSERRFEWQQLVFSASNLGLSWRSGS
jgi:hypothetical protein